MPKVSIYLSSYNHARYLAAAIQSVLDQTFTDFELFIWDDASTDDSWSIIQGFADPRIRPYRNPANRNDKENLRKVIRELAAGEYIAIHHSDGLWAPTKLQQQVDFLDANPGFGAVFTRAQVIDENGRPFQDRSSPYFSVFEQPNRTRYEWLHFFFYSGNALCHPSVLIRKQCFEDCGLYRDGFAQLPDLDMWVRLCLKYQIRLLPQKLVSYRVPSHRGFVSASRPANRIRFHFEYLQILNHYLAIPNFIELLRIFPEAARYNRPDGYDLGFILAMLALERSPTNPEFALWALDQLFTAVTDPPRAERIRELYGFGHQDFIRLSAQYDAFNLEPASQLKTFWSRLRQRLRRIWPHLS